MRLQFADFVFDSGTREVTRNGTAVSLPPKAFQILEALITERPNAISKASLHERLWPDTFVSDANLANLVADLRLALGDDAKRPHIIRTVQRFGYAFQAEARPVPERGSPGPFAFRLVWGNREIPLVEGDNVLGRDADVAAWIDVYSVSRRHARIVISGDRATLQDLDSKNGTYLRGKAVTGPKPVALSDGDEIRIGTVVMTLRRFAGVTTEALRSG